MGPETPGPTGLIGRVIGGYRLERVLGTGETSAVLLGQHVDAPEQQAAIKILMPPSEASAAVQRELRGAFSREAQTLFALQHPHIVGIYAFGVDVVTGSPYMVLQYPHGGTLAKRLAGGALPLPTTARVLSQLADALDAAHALGIVHGDVSPANVLLDEQEQVYLSGFSATTPLSPAPGTGSSALRDSRMNPAAMAESVAYWAPERAGGHDVGPAADIYSLGVVLYQMVTGYVPFQGATQAIVLLQHAQLPPPPPRALRPDVPEGAETAILRTLAKQPSERFATASTLAEAFCAVFALGAGMAPAEEPDELDAPDAPDAQGTGAPGIRDLQDAGAAIAPDPQAQTLSRTAPTPAEGNSYNSHADQAREPVREPVAGWFSIVPIVSAPPAEVDTSVESAAAIPPTGLTATPRTDDAPPAPPPADLPSPVQLASPVVPSPAAAPAEASRPDDPVATDEPESPRAIAQPESPVATPPLDDATALQESAGEVALSQSTQPEAIAPSHDSMAPAQPVEPPGPLQPSEPADDRTPEQPPNGVTALPAPYVALQTPVAPSGQALPAAAVSLAASDTATAQGTATAQVVSATEADNAAAPAPASSFTPVLVRSIMLVIFATVMAMAAIAVLHVLGAFEFVLMAVILALFAFIAIVVPNKPAGSLAGKGAVHTAGQDDQRGAEQTAEVGSQGGVPARS